MSVQQSATKQSRMRSIWVEICAIATRTAQMLIIQLPPTAWAELQRKATIRDRQWLAESRIGVRAKGTESPSFRSPSEANLEETT